MSSDLYYRKLKSLVTTGRLSIRLIIAPSRTNSSLVEHVIGNSPDIDSECHEPFLGARHEGFDPDHGYKEIYESIGGQESEMSDQKTNIVIKEMSHCIGINGEYKRLSELVNEPIAILIRNPLLSTESRIRRILTTITMRENINLQRFLLDESERMGESLGQDFLCKKSSEELYNAADLAFQNELLDIMARRNGFPDWKNMLKNKLYVERDYAFFSGILEVNKHRLNTDEFEKLAEEERYFKDYGRKCIIVDTTDLRACPEEQVHDICSELGIRFSDEMLHWRKKSVDFYTEQTQEFERLWYDSLLASTHIEPPTEIPPRLATFPDFMQKYLGSDSLPIYAELSKKKMIKNELKRELNQREFSLQVTDGNVEYLRKIGLLGENDLIGAKISVKLKRIDPVYAATNESSLFEAREFCVDRETYADEIKIVHDIVLDQDESSREYKNRQ